MKKLLACFLLLLPAGSLLADAAAALPDNKGFATVQAILAKSCSDCHDWTGSWDTIAAGGRVIAGFPEKSILYQKISTDEMPAAGDKLTADQKAFIKGWILAGAPATDLPISVPAANAGSPAQEAEALSASTSPATGFLFFPSKVAFHETTGFTSTGLLLAAGIVGGIHFLDMMSAAHAYRDAVGFQEGGSEAVRAAEIESVWAGDSTMRWWHVGLIISGETLYLGDALTGVSMFTRSQPGKLTKHDIHRYAFFTHAALMVAQVGLGFAETWALSTGQHDLMVGIGGAHAAIGIAIPLVMLGAGLENLLLPE